MTLNKQCTTAYIKSTPTPIAAKITWKTLQVPDIPPLNNPEAATLAEPDHMQRTSSCCNRLLSLLRNRWKQMKTEHWAFIEFSLGFHWVFIEFSCLGISRGWAEFRRDEAADPDLRLIRREEMYRKVRKWRRNWPLVINSLTSFNDRDEDSDFHLLLSYSQLGWQLVAMLGLLHCLIFPVSIWEICKQGVNASRSRSSEWNTMSNQSICCRLFCWLNEWKCVNHVRL